MPLIAVPVSLTARPPSCTLSMVLPAGSVTVALQACAPFTVSATYGTICWREVSPLVLSYMKISIESTSTVSMRGLTTHTSTLCGRRNVVSTESDR